MISEINPVTGPTMKRGKSKQDVETPPEFIAAVEKRFGKIVFDLAASAENTKHPDFFSKEQDSLKQEWHKIAPHAGWLWLNPEFDDITVWATKCAAEMELGARIIILTPASVGANWYRDWVRPSAHSVFLGNRIQFVGSDHGYPKDLMCSIYMSGVTGDSFWKWK